MKRVGVLIRKDEFNKNKYYALKKDLITYLDKADVLIIGIFFQRNLKKVFSALKICSGIILPGGDIENPEELKIIDFLYQNDIPTLGICLGMQMMCLYKNGIIAHLKNNYHKSDQKYVHTLKIKNNTILSDIFSKNTIMVNSRHQDYIISTDLEIIALSNDGIIEAVTDPTKRFFLGVQWHPESIFTDKYSKLLLKKFISLL